MQIRVAGATRRKVIKLQWFTVTYAGKLTL